MRIDIELKDRLGETLASASGNPAAQLVFDREYEDGDRLVVTADPGSTLRIQLDPALPEALLYLPDGRMTYVIPRGEALTAYAPFAFQGTRHLAYACVALPHEANGRRDLARNALDLPGGTGAYPHIHANAETRGESVFAARNVIDGCRANHGHGEWPWLSWGVDIAVDAKVTLEFGRPVTVDGMGICLRADFPHDSWWPQATLVLSDGTRRVFSMEKTDALQLIDIGRHTVSWARIEQWIKYDEPAQFPALIAWEMYGMPAVE